MLYFVVKASIVITAQDATNLSQWKQHRSVTKRRVVTQ